MKKGSIIALALGLLISWGCTHEPVIPLKTVYSDLQPQQSRTQYYKDIAQAYYQNEDYNEASEYFKLSLLHDPTNYESRIGLASAYHQLNLDNLALVELDKLDGVNNFNQNSDR